MATLQTVLQNIASYINQDPTLQTGTDLTSQVNLVNQSQNEWADTYQWSILRKPYSPSYAVSAVSIGLPSTFKKMMSPLADYQTIPPTIYSEVDPSERMYKLTTDKYCYLTGDDGTGHALIVNPPLPSGASLQLDLQVQPTALATLSDVVTCPSVQFLTLRTISKILSARSDPRFPQIKADSDDIMASMIEEEMAGSKGKTNRTPDQFSRVGFRIGLS